MARPRKNTQNNPVRDMEDRNNVQNATEQNVAAHDMEDRNSVSDNSSRDMQDQTHVQNDSDNLITTEQAREIVKKNDRYSHPRPNWGNENMEPGDNARYLRLARASQNLPPIDIADPKQVEDRINAYFDFCEDNDRKPNVVGMANWLGVDRRTLLRWRSGDYRTETHCPLIEKTMDLLEENWADMMMNGKVNPASGIFIGKNHYGYKDVQDVVVTPKNPMGDEQNADELRERIGENVIYVDPDEQNG